MNFPPEIVIRSFGLSGRSEVAAAAERPVGYQRCDQRDGEAASSIALIQTMQ